MLNREDIKNAADYKVESVAVPEWGGDVCVRTMTAAARDEWETECFGPKAPARRNVRASLAVRCVCDASGTLLFTRADAAWLGNKSAVALDRVYSVAARLNGIGLQEDAEKNSEPTTGDDSSSA